MRIDLQRTADGAILAAEGRLTASEAWRVHRALLEAFSGGGRVELAVRDVQEADLSFVQLLCAAHRSAASRNLIFTVSGLESAAPVQRLIREAGAERGVGCPEGCLWPGASPAAVAPGERA